MAVDMFMKIDDIKGESPDETHAEAIEVLAWSWGMSQSGSAHSGTGAGTGKVSVQDLSFTKYVDRSTPVLLKQCCTGKHFKLATLIVRKAGGDKPLEYVTIELHDGLIASVNTGGSGGEDRLTENVVLNFAAFKYIYNPQQEKAGSGTGAIPMTWNIAKNAEKVP